DRLRLRRGGQLRGGHRAVPAVLPGAGAQHFPEAFREEDLGRGHGRGRGRLSGLGRGRPLGDPARRGLDPGGRRARGRRFRALHAGAARLRARPGLQPVLSPPPDRPGTGRGGPESPNRRRAYFRGGDDPAPGPARHPDAREDVGISDFGFWIPEAPDPWPHSLSGTRTTRRGISTSIGPASTATPAAGSPRRSSPRLMTIPSSRGSPRRRRRAGGPWWRRWAAPRGPCAPAPGARAGSAP